MSLAKAKPLRTKALPKEDDPAEAAGTADPSTTTAAPEPGATTPATGAAQPKGKQGDVVVAQRAIRRSGSGYVSAAPAPILTMTSAPASASTVTSTATVTSKSASASAPASAPAPVPVPVPLSAAPPVFVAHPHAGAETEYSLTHLIEQYGERTDLLKLVLSAKTEQDRARAEYERRLQEELKYETRRLEFEMLLHENMFRQQEREHEDKRMMGLHGAPVRRADVLVASPGASCMCGAAPTAHPPHPPAQSMQQQQQQPPPPLQQQAMHTGPPAAGTGPYGPYGHMRAYHHPDTPGGPDARGGQNPFAFFKMPLGGAPLHHPSAYRPANAGPLKQYPPNPQQQQQPQQPQQQLGIRERRRHVPPAVSGLSVRIVNPSAADAMADAAPRSAPVDGPSQNNKRKISHDEVIMALRRKVLAKGGLGNSNPHAPQQQQQHGSALGEPRRSSLALITRVREEDEEELQAEAGAISAGTSSSESSESAESSVSMPLGSRGNDARQQRQQQQQQRLPSISVMLEPENTNGGASLVGEGDTVSQE
ncbi:hypothetical protein GGI07_001911 [Coemansia sp. Benny D115]|nr:hypothetical protein GGI07_001911 [Coemansia sp. Benny D115]